MQTDAEWGGNECGGFQKRPQWFSETTAVVLEKRAQSFSERKVFVLERESYTF